jgi:alanyl aminopeptidase
MGFWDDLWLNEAFATWMAARTVHRVRPDFDGAFDLRETGAWAMGEDSLMSARRIREPIENRGDVDNAFDVRTARDQNLLPLPGRLAFVGLEVRP